MTTKELMYMIAQDVFGPRFHEELNRRYQADAAEGKLGTLETEYLAAKEYLLRTLPPEKQHFLTQYESLAEQTRYYQGSYGFLAGLYCGFRQLFTQDSAPDGGFQETVVSELFTLPRMNGHEYIRRNTEDMKALADHLSPEEDSLEDITCAWEQRAYSAAVHGFFLGYHTALSLSELIHPTPGSRLKMLGKVLSMEHILGISDLARVS